MAQRYQHGHLRKAKRVNGSVWEFLWRERGDDGKTHQRTLVVGSLKQFRTEREALSEIQTLRSNINRDCQMPALLTLQKLAEHYCSTELLSKSVKTQITNRGYLNNWILKKWGSVYLHAVKAVSVEDWLGTLDLTNGSKAKIRNIMSAVFSHGIRYELVAKNPITAVRQSAKRSKVPTVLEPAEMHRIFDLLAVRERAMIVTDALTGIRRGELMGLKWEDLDFIQRKINVVRSVVDQEIGACKTEASHRPVPMDEHTAQVLTAWRQESVYTKPQDWVWASPHKRGKQPYWLSTIMRYFVQPAAKAAGVKTQIGWHTFRHTFSTLIKSLGTDAKVVQELLRHASFKTTMDTYTQVLSEPKRQAQERLADLIMREGKCGHA